MPALPQRNGQNSDSAADPRAGPTPLTSILSGIFLISPPCKLHFYWSWETNCGGKHTSFLSFTTSTDTFFTKAPGFSALLHFQQEKSIPEAPFLCCVQCSLRSGVKKQHLPFPPGTAGSVPNLQYISNVATSSSASQQRLLQVVFPREKAEAILHRRALNWAERSATLPLPQLLVR